MKIATLAVITQDGEILLGKKKKGEIGINTLSGPGGKLDEGETLEECLVRETREELEIELDRETLELVAIIDFYAAGELDFRVYTYRASILYGEIHETANMIPAWYPLNDATFSQTYEADRYLLPWMVAGEKFCANVYYR